MCRVSILIPLFLLVSLTGLTGMITGCAISRPCAEGGDLTGLPAVKGNKQCYQKKFADGRYLNDGKFIAWHSNGKIAIEGQFREGEKDGTWYFYDENGKKTAERTFFNGVEKSGVPESSSTRTR